MFPPDKPKPSVNFVLKKFSTYFSLFRIKKWIKHSHTEGHTDKQIEAEIKGFFAIENLNAETKKDEVSNRFNLNEK